MAQTGWYDRDIESKDFRELVAEYELVKTERHVLLAHFLASLPEPAQKALGFEGVERLQEEITAEARDLLDNTKKKSHGH